MTAQIPSVLKSYFENGDKPTQGQFADLIDSSLNVVQPGGQSIISDISAGGSLAVAGNSTFAGTVLVSGAFTAPGFSVNASGQSTLSGNTSIAGTFSVTSSAQSNLSGNVIVSGNATIHNLVGVTNGSNAPSGIIGEYMESLVSAATSFGASGDFGVAATLNLTAGDWDTSFSLYATANGATCRTITGNISVASSSIGVNGISQNNNIGPTVNSDSFVSVDSYRVNVASSTALYANIQAFYTSGPPQYQARFCVRRRY